MWLDTNSKSVRMTSLLAPTTLAFRSSSSNPSYSAMLLVLSGILPGYSCKEGRIVEDGLLVEFPCTPTRTRSVYSY
jgi:hypothetical protein